MKTVLSTFTRRDDAHAAAEHLRRQGLALDGVSVHDRPTVPDPSSASRIDQFASGGVFTDLYWLLENLFGPGSGEVTRNLADGIPAGGAVVVVRSPTDEEAARAQATLLEAGAAGQYAIPREGDLG